MVLNELGQKISQALAMVNNAETIDEKVHGILWSRSHTLLQGSWGMVTSS